MRNRILYNSVNGLLADEEHIRAVVHMWQRHRLLLPYALAAFVAVLAVAIAAGINSWSSRLGLGLAAAAIASMALTEYRILAHTTSGLVLLRSSRVRQRATELVKRLPDSTHIAPVSSNLVITDWTVGSETFSVMKRYQSAMVAISQR